MMTLSETMQSALEYRKFLGAGNELQHLLPPWIEWAKKLESEVERLEAKVALLEHEAKCHWCEVCSPGDWTRNQCPDCERLQKALEPAEKPWPTSVVAAMPSSGGSAGSADSTAP